jgi:hypothetical protein
LFWTQDETVKAKEPTTLARRTTRWWKAPVRLPTAAFKLLSKTTLGRFWPKDCWLEHRPAGIRAHAEQQ